MSKDLVEDLQAVSQHVLTLSQRISELEAAKRTVDPASSEFRELSDEIERLGDEIRSVSHAETDIAVRLTGKDDLPTVNEADASDNAEQ